MPPSAALTATVLLMAFAPVHALGSHVGVPARPLHYLICGMHSPLPAQFSCYNHRACMSPIVNILPSHKFTARLPFGASRPPMMAGLTTGPCRRLRVMPMGWAAHSHASVSSEATSYALLLHELSLYELLSAWPTCRLHASWVGAPGWCTRLAGLAPHPGRAPAMRDLHTGLLLCSQHGTRCGTFCTSAHCRSSQRSVGRRSAGTRHPPATLHSKMCSAAGRWPPAYTLHSRGGRPDISSGGQERIRQCCAAQVALHSFSCRYARHKRTGCIRRAASKARAQGSPGHSPLGACCGRCTALAAITTWNALLGCRQKRAVGAAGQGVRHLDRGSITVSLVCGG